MKKLLVGLLALGSIFAWSAPAMIGEYDDILHIGKNTLSFTVLEDINVLANAMKEKISTNCSIKLDQKLDSESRLSKGKEIEISSIIRENRYDVYYYSLIVSNFKKIRSIECKGKFDGLAVIQLKAELGGIFKANIEERVIELD